MRDRPTKESSAQSSSSAGFSSSASSSSEDYYEEWLERRSHSTTSTTTTLPMPALSDKTLYTLMLPATLKSEPNSAGDICDDPSDTQSEGESPRIYESIHNLFFGIDSTNNKQQSFSPIKKSGSEPDLFTPRYSQPHK